MINFYSFHGDPQRKTAALIAVRVWLQESGGTISIIRALAAGSDDLAAAHRASGFPAPLLLLCETLCQRLPEAEAVAFVTGVLEDAACEADLSGVADQFVADLDPAQPGQHHADRLRAIVRAA
ncbi:hypothetical protein P1X14_11815 [Sphingomonas sp. AOB5]|uniref:hypothetical protein n=1 Tax=Sphingomonas sp. AOB5 TaxID=3034017 RepID=UPI0023F81E94|nr:hypothetical protein [Sphingomonas sp. AOB5]MDF7775934.1 hypothetical protein [Sphingomonas sp. AOB5]